MTRNKPPIQRKTRRTGPKPKWKTMENGLEYVTNLARLGLTGKEIADAFGVVEQTFYNWWADNPEFRDAVERGRLESTASVVGSIYKRALGCSVPETRIVLKKVREFDEQGNLLREYSQPVPMVVEKHFPPDTGAAIFILHNRTRHLENAWSNRQHIELTGKDGKDLQLKQEIDTSKLSLKQLKAAKELFPEMLSDK